MDEKASKSQLEADIKLAMELYRLAIETGETMDMGGIDVPADISKAKFTDLIIRYNQLPTNEQIAVASAMGEHWDAMQIYRQDLVDIRRCEALFKRGISDITDSDMRKLRKHGYKFLLLVTAGAVVDGEIYYLCEIWKDGE